MAGAATRVAPTELSAPLLEHLRTDPDGFSPAEARAFLAEQDERTQQDFDRAVAQARQDDAFKASAQAVRDTLQQELDALGRHAAPVNQAHAALAGAYYATRAAQLGITPEQLFERRRLRVAAEGVGGDALNQDRGAPTDTPEFKRWFGDSKVVDADGKPLVFYHGTASDFDTFSKTKSNDKNGRQLGMGWGKGKFYFATTGEAASSAAAFAQATGRGSGQNVMPVYLSVKKPIDAAEFQRRIADEQAAGKTRDQAIAAVDKAIRREGYDGIVDADSGGIAVFDPEQIKSATGNNGNFDPNDPNILHQSATDQTARAAAEVAAVQAANREDNGLRDKRRADELWEEYTTDSTVDGRELDLEGLERDEDGDLTDAGFQELDERARQRIAEVAEAESRTIEDLADIDHFGTSRMAYGAARAWLDGMGVHYRELPSAGALYLEIDPPAEVVQRLEDAGDAPETLKLRFSNHANQSGQHTKTDWNWVEGGIPSGSDATLAEMLDVALRYSRGETGLGERVHYQSGLTPTGQAMAKWQRSLAALGPRNPQQEARMPTPAVLQEMGVAAPKLALSGERLRNIRDKHRGVPPEVFQNLPALLADPLFVYPYRDGGVRVVVEATTRAGAPIAVGVTEGRITTVTELEGAGRLAADLNRALQGAGAKVYARQKESLAEARLSSEGQSRPNPEGAQNKDKAIVRYRSHLVKRLGAGFYQGSTAPRGTFSPERLTISLLKGADLSTFLHEGGHFFFENDIALASGIVASQRQGASITPGEQQLLDDVGRLLSWHGLKGDVAGQLTEWHNLPFEEKRAHHEKTAESFEAYLFAGQAATARGALVLGHQLRRGARAPPQDPARARCRMVAPGGCGKFESNRPPAPVQQAQEAIQSIAHQDGPGPGRDAAAAPSTFSRYHSGWWCLAQPALTVPWVMARSVPLTQMAA